MHTLIWALVSVFCSELVLLYAKFSPKLYDACYFLEGLTYPCPPFIKVYYRIPLYIYFLKALLSILTSYWEFNYNLPIFTT